MLLEQNCCCHRCDTEKKNKKTKTEYAPNLVV